MSVPPDRMAPRTGATMKDPNKIMGLPKWAFWAIIVVGLILAWYIWKRSQSQNAAALQTANAGAQPDTTNGVTAADIGGTPADNSFATNTDAMALEEQIQTLENSIAELEAAHPGSTTGAGIPSTTTPNNYPSPTPIPITNNIESRATTPILDSSGSGINTPIITGRGGIGVPVFHPGVGSTPVAVQNLYAAGITGGPVRAGGPQGI